MESAFERTGNRMVHYSEDALGNGKGQESSFEFEGCHITFLDDCKRIPRTGFLRALWLAPLEDAISKAHLTVPRYTSMILNDERTRKENR